VYARILAYIQGRFTVDTYVRRYIRVHVCYTHPYIPTLICSGIIVSRSLPSASLFFQNILSIS